MKPGNRQLCNGANSSRVNLRDERKAVTKTPRIPPRSFLFHLSSDLRHTVS
jgi:hypothetical protein